MGLRGISWHVFVSKYFRYMNEGGPVDALDEPPDIVAANASIVGDDVEAGESVFDFDGVVGNSEDAGDEGEHVVWVFEDEIRSTIHPAYMAEMGMIDTYGVCVVHISFLREDCCSACSVSSIQVRLFLCVLPPLLFCARAGQSCSSLFAAISFSISRATCMHLFRWLSSSCLR